MRWMGWTPRRRAVPAGHMVCHLVCRSCGAVMCGVCLAGPDGHASTALVMGRLVMCGHLAHGVVGVQDSVPVCRRVQNSVSAPGLSRMIRQTLPIQLQAASESGKGRNSASQDTTLPCGVCFM